MNQPKTAEEQRNAAVTRLTAVVAAVLAALAVWTIARPVFGIRLRPPDGFGPASDIDALNVVFASAFTSLAGWGLLALLERLTIYARTIWGIVAVSVLLLSLVTPLFGTGITAANRTALLLMHLAVGAVLIPVLYLTSPRATRTANTRRAQKVPRDEPDAIGDTRAG
jgi:hypothetical protein